MVFDDSIRVREKHIKYFLFVNLVIITCELFLACLLVSLTIMLFLFKMYLAITYRRTKRSDIRQIEE